MPMAEHEVTIARPPEEVFAFLADGTNDPQWRPAVADVAHESGSGAGARYRQGMKGPMGRRIPADFEITEHEPPRALAFRVTAGPVRPRGRYELTPAGAGTAVRFRLECELSGPKKVFMSRPVQKSMDGEVRNLERLKQVLETA
jgi:uncharacterized protein YndB with AHSA1/START domain